MSRDTNQDAHTDRERRPTSKLLISLVAIATALRAARLYPTKPDLHVDLASFIDSGRAFLWGRNPYVADSTLLPGVNTDTPNLNPPISLPVFALLGELNTTVAFELWYVLSCVLYMGLVWLLLHSFPQRSSVLPLAWLLNLDPLWLTLLIGQIYVPLALVAAIAFIGLERRPGAAGALIGLLMAVKPNFAIWPILLLCAGALTPAVVAVAVAGAITVFAGLAYGPGMYAAWLAATTRFGLTSGVINSSLYGVSIHLGIPVVGAIASAGVVCAAVVASWWMKPTARTVSCLGIIIALLCSPITWPGYALFALPVIFSLGWSRTTLAAAVLLAIPSEFGTLLPPNWLVPWVVALQYPVSFILTGAAAISMAWRQWNGVRSRRLNFAGSTVGDRPS